MKVFAQEVEPDVVLSKSFHVNIFTKYFKIDLNFVKNITVMGLAGC